jgi:hypothetical protein
MKTDVLCELPYAVNPTTGGNFTPAYSSGKVFIAAPEFGVAEIFGTFESVGNSFNGPLNITSSAPITLHPAALEKWFGTTITDANAESVPVTIMLNGGELRTLNLGAKRVSFHHRYNLDVGKRAVV